jgi:ATP-binding cassette subfamily B protein
LKKEASLKERIHRTLHLKEALTVVWESGPKWVILNLLLVLIKGLVPLVLLYLTKLVVDAVTNSLGGADTDGAFGHIAFLICLMGLATLVMDLCRSLSLLVNEAQSLAVTDHVHDILHDKSVEVDLEYYENAHYYDNLHRAQQEAPNRPTRIVNGLVQMGQNGISLLVMAGLLFAFHWAVPLVLFVAAVPGLVVRMKYAGKMYRWQRERTATERAAYYYHYLLTRDVNAKEVRLFDLGGMLMGRYNDLRRLLRKERIQIVKQRSIADSITQSSSTLAVFAAYAFIAYRTVQGQITLGDLVMYFAAFQRGQQFLQQAMSGLSGLYEDNLFLSHLTEFLKLKPKVKEPDDPRPVPRPMEEGIEIDHVDFRYPTGTRSVLEDVTLTIRPGEHVALVGENGSGKTTLVKLLCRLYDPTAGRIRLGGIDLREFTTTALRREISVILQDFLRYHLTARENIWLGNVDLDLHDGAVEAAARQSRAEGVIQSLPQGFDTVLGKYFERGEELSMGEWQKVALARAYLRRAQVIVLDEPTSSMDAKAEYEVFKNFSQLAQDRTTILISHRLSTVRMVDRIYVMDHGRILESGTHDELIRGNGKYKQLFELQAKNYQ